MLPYSLVVNENNSYPYKNKEEIEVKFMELLEDIKSGKAQNKVIEGKKWVKEERSLEKEAGEVVKLYKSILPEETQRELI